MEPVLIAPSLLACDFGRMAEEIAAVQDAGCDWLHIDVMDGHFVPNLSMGPAITKAAAKASRTFVDVHLMVEYPEAMLEPFVEAGAEALTVHVEAKGLPDEAAVRAILRRIRREFGIQAGLSIRPKTEVAALYPYLDQIDLVLVMSVEPGFGGQSFLPAAVDKVRELRARFGGHISVDGGINEETGRLVREAGADVLVAGTTIFKARSYAQIISSLRGEA